MPRSARSAEIRRVVALTQANAFLWAIGNGLVSTTLVVYLAQELGARGLAVSAVIASPRLAGVLRLAAPRLIAAAERLVRRVAGEAARGWGRKGLCLVGYAASGALLTAMPVVALWGSGAPAEGAPRAGALAALVTAWCAYHLAEYAATIALWSWLGDLYPRRARPLLLGHRERLLVVGRVAGIGVSIGLAAAWSALLPTGERWAPLAASAAVGAAVIVAAVAPLALLPAVAAAPSALPASPWRTLAVALRTGPLRRLLAYSCWLGVANGVTQSAQSLYARGVLGLGYEHQRLLESAMYAGQSLVAAPAGKWIVRFGAARVMFVAQLLVATGPLFFWAAQPAPPWWGPWTIALAYVAWVAYAPINVGLDVLKLDAADPRNNAPYLAVYHTLSDLVNAAMVLAGGLLYDTLARGDTRSLDAFATLFLLGAALRALAAGFAWRLEGAKHQ